MASKKLRPSSDLLFRLESTFLAPPVAPEDLADHYRDICRYILYAGADLPAARKRRKRRAAKAKR